MEDYGQHVCVPLWVLSTHVGAKHTRETQEATRESWLDPVREKSTEKIFERRNLNVDKILDNIKSSGKVIASTRFKDQSLEPQDSC